MGASKTGVGMTSFQRSGGDTAFLTEIDPANKLQSDIVGRADYSANFYEPGDVRISYDYRGDDVFAFKSANEGEMIAVFG